MEAWRSKPLPKRSPRALCSRVQAYWAKAAESLGSSWVARRASAWASLPMPASRRARESCEVMEGVVGAGGDEFAIDGEGFADVAGGELAGSGLVEVDAYVVALVEVEDGGAEGDGLVGGQGGDAGVEAEAGFDYAGLGGQVGFGEGGGA